LAKNYSEQQAEMCMVNQYLNGYAGMLAAATFVDPCAIKID